MASHHNRSKNHLLMGIEDRSVRSLKDFKARMCDCGNPICFGTLTSQDVSWLVRVYESTKSQLRGERAQAKDVG